MRAPTELQRLDDLLNRLAALYQFRSLDDRLYDALTVSQSYCLRILFFGGTRTMTELAAALDVRVSTMTGVVDQLEERGFVRRVDHPRDRRSVRVELTSKGRALYGKAHEAFLSHLAPLLEHQPAAARQPILEFLAEVIQTIQAWRDNPRKVGRHGHANPDRGARGRGGRAGDLRTVRLR
jgi:DNA-binding MarR family transcriptional regulator